MTYLLVAYLLIVVVLSGYGVSLWRRMRATQAEIRRLDLPMPETRLPFGRGGR
jgi:hypothetical protein